METVTRLDAARRQLHTAIGLWLVDGDTVSVHTLAFAAFGIVSDLNRINKGPPLLLEATGIKPEKRDEFVYLLKRDANFFKHADGRVKRKKQQTPNATDAIEFTSELNELLMATAVKALIHLKQDISDKEKLFQLWYAIHRPDLHSDAWIDLLQNSSHVHVESLRLLKKQEFFDRVSQAIRRP